MDEIPKNTSRFLRYPLCTIISFCLVIALCLECFMSTFSEHPFQRTLDLTASSLPSSDASTLIDVRDFRFRINNLVCADAAPILLVLVHSAPVGRPKRDAVRATWAAEAKTSTEYKVLFLLGDVDTPEMQKSLELENDEHQDLVQGAFRDVYQNATYKHAMALKWTVYHCPKTRIVFKVDDDAFLNTKTILEFFSHDMPAFWTHGLILCNLATNLQVNRNPSAKRYVPTSVYSESTYPVHCQGEMIAYTPDVVLALYREAQKTPYFRIDDVHITGTLRQNINATAVPFGPLSLEPKQVDEMIQKMGDGIALKPSSWPFWTGHSGMSQTLIYKFWNVTQESEKSGRPLENIHMGLCPYP